MSTDEKVTQELVQTLEDGKQGYEAAASRLEESGHSEQAAVCRNYSTQRAEFSDNLKRIAGTYGDDVDQSGTVTGTLHRSWLALKDALSGSGAHAVLAAAVQGEDHAVEEYDKALAADISPEFRSTVQQQAAAVREARDRMIALRDAAKDR